MIEWILMIISIGFIFVVSGAYVREIVNARRAGNNQLFYAFIIAFVVLWIMYIGTLAYIIITRT